MSCSAPIPTRRRRARFAAYGRDVVRSVLDGVPLREPEPMSEAQFRLIQAYYAQGRHASADVWKNAFAPAASPERRESL